MNKKIQAIRTIPLKDLVLWVDNPRDNIPENSTDQDIANLAVNGENKNKWNLKDQFEKMKFADNNELNIPDAYHLNDPPIVVYKNEKYIVYDGNRRVIIGKLIHNLVQVPGAPEFPGFHFPKKLPCNVCEEKFAIMLVIKKHAKSGSWHQLERDIFSSKHLRKKPKPWLVLNQATHIISDLRHVISKSTYERINSVYVRDQVFTSTRLHKMGFAIDGNRIKSCHNSTEDAMKVLSKVVELVCNGKTGSRIKRGLIIEMLESDIETSNILKYISSSKKEFSHGFCLNINERKTLQEMIKSKISNNLTLEPKIIPGIKEPVKPNGRKTPILKLKTLPIFGGKIFLKKGSVNDLYSDIDNIYINYSAEKYKYSGEFILIIRMALRLICEIAAKEIEAVKVINGEGKLLNRYLEKYHVKTRKTLSEEQINILNGANIKIDIHADDIACFLHKGAHGKPSAKFSDQTIALSVIVGKILEESHGKR